jgi:hypothetical protein
MSPNPEQAQHAATPPCHRTPGIRPDQSLPAHAGLSFAQEILARLIFSLASVLILAQISRMLAQFEAMKALWLAGKLPGLPPPPARAAPATPRAPRPAPRPPPGPAPLHPPHAPTPSRPAPGRGIPAAPRAQPRSPRTPGPGTLPPALRLAPPVPPPGPAPAPPPPAPPPLPFFRPPGPHAHARPHCSTIIPFR